MHISGWRLEADDRGCEQQSCDCTGLWSEHIAPERQGYWSTPEEGTSLLAFPAASTSVYKYARRYDWDLENFESFQCHRDVDFWLYLPAERNHILWLQLGFLCSLNVPRTWTIVHRNVAFGWPQTSNFENGEKNLWHQEELNSCAAVTFFSDCIFLEVAIDFWQQLPAFGVLLSCLSADFTHSHSLDQRRSINFVAMLSGTWLSSLQLHCWSCNFLPFLSSIEWPNGSLLGVGVRKSGRIELWSKMPTGKQMVIIVMIASCEIDVWCLVTFDAKCVKIETCKQSDIFLCTDDKNLLVLLHESQDFLLCKTVLFCENHPRTKLKDKLVTIR